MYRKIADDGIFDKKNLINFVVKIRTYTGIGNLKNYRDV